MSLRGTSSVKSYAAVADYFIALANETGDFISNLKLQKLVYYAEAWHLANYDDSLIKEEFQAWVHGPAIPALYGEYKNFGWQPIIRTELVEGTFDGLKSKFSQRSNLLLKAVVDSYFPLTAFELEKMTHNELPWIEARQGLPDDAPSNNIISKVSMKAYYSSFIKHDVPPSK